MHNKETNTSVRLDSVWVFMGEGARFPCAVFIDKEMANDWIKKHMLSGTLTEYPLDIGIYEWAIKNNFFSASKDHEFSKEFIQRFTSASQNHAHYENGEID